MRIVRLAFILGAALGLLLSPSAAGAQPACTFKLGFATLRDLVAAQGRDVVGQCLEDEHFELATGNALQRTSGGLLVWRKADNWTAFTDGATTWLNGPEGLASRPNAGPLFPWEAANSPAPAAPPTPQTGKPPEPRFRPNWMEEGGPLCSNEPPVAIQRGWQVSAPRGSDIARAGQSFRVGLRNRAGQPAERYDITARVFAPSGAFSTATGELVGDVFTYFIYPRDFASNSGQGPGVYTVVWESRGGFLACDGFVVQ